MHKQFGQTLNRVGLSPRILIDSVVNKQTSIGLIYGNYVKPLLYVGKAVIGRMKK